MNQSKLNLEQNIPLKQFVELQQEIDSKSMAWKIAETADDRKGEEIVLLNVEGMSFIADYFVIVTGFSKVQLRAISDAVENKMVEEYNKFANRIEGKNDASWILHDYGDVIVHIFMPNERKFYDLEAFWAGAEKINFSS